MQKIAAKQGMAMVVPVYEEQMPGLYFNTAADIEEAHGQQNRGADSLEKPDVLNALENDCEVDEPAICPQTHS